MVPIREFTIPLPDYLEERQARPFPSFDFEDDNQPLLRKRCLAEVNNENNNIDNFEVRKVVKVVRKGAQGVTKVSKSFEFVEKENSYNGVAGQLKRPCLND